MEMVHFIPASQRRLALLAAQADSLPVLISGATGTGKGAIACWIHANGPRTSLPCLTAQIGSAPITAQILDAKSGTLVVPEIGDWSLAEQKSLVHYLRTRSVPHPESRMPMIARARIIATTSQDFNNFTSVGLLTLHLLEKLKGFKIEMPALARRAVEFEDIVLGITGEITRELRKEHLRSLSSAAWTRLRSYDWPGNIRELRNVLRMAVASSKGSRIEDYDMPDFGYSRIDFRTTREQFEKIYITELLKTFNWEIDRTCSMSHMDRTTLLSKIEHYGIRQSVN